MSHRTAAVHALYLMEKFEQFKTSKTICDFNLKAGNKNFPVHRVVLAASSIYFESMFTHETKESQSGTAEFENIDAEAARKCIDFMYTGNADFTMENVRKLMKASKEMELNDLNDQCAREIINSLTVGNCLGYRRLGQECSSDKLKEAAMTYAVGHFDSVISTDDFVFLEFTELLDFMKAPAEETVTSETAKWNALIKWVNHDFRNRKSHFVDLFKHINLRCFPPEFIKETIVVDRLVDKYKKSRDLANDAIFEHVTGDNQERKIAKAMKEASTPSPHVAVLDAISGAINGVSLRSQRKCVVKQVSAVKNQHIFSAITSVGGKLYLLVDKGIFEISKKHNIPKGTMENSPQTTAKVVPFGDDTVYVVENDRMACCKLKTGIWNEAMLPCNLAQVECAAASDNSIFVLGDNNKGKRYSPSMEKWTDLSPMMNIRKGSEAVVLNGLLYVIGGEGCDKIPCSTVKCYNPENGYWTKKANMIKARSHFSAFVLENKICVVGGSIETNSKLMPIEVYDEDANDWSTAADIVCVNGAVSACWFYHNN